MTAAESTALLARLLEERHSVRGFRPEPLAEAELCALLAMAQRAPSWCNIQPWRVVITGPALTRQLAAALQQAARTGLPAPELGFPPGYPEPYLGHRRRCGGALYGAMGVARDDHDGRYQAWLRNYALFDAPHLAVVTRDRRLGEYATLDVGVWLGILLTAAQAMGIAACPMASVAAYPAPLRELCEIPAEHTVLFGVALGREDPQVPANACRTERSPLADNVRFLGFS
jgi:nitroreductase